MSGHRTGDQQGIERTWLKPRPGTLTQTLCVLLGLASGQGDRDLREAFLPPVGEKKEVGGLALAVALQGRSTGKGGGSSWDSDSGKWR